VLAGSVPAVWHHRWGNLYGDVWCKGLMPYVAFSGLGAGWHLTRPLGVVAVGPDGILFTAFFFAVRVGIALILGWLVLVPYIAYLIVRCIRN
jgi:hypothetical protein